MFCYFYTEPIYFFFFPAEQIDGFLTLLYYTHIPTAIIALLVGLFVFLNGRKLILNRVLFALSVCFAIWIILSLLSWTNIRADFILFSWPFFGVTQALISILSIYFIAVFVDPDKSDVSLKTKLLFIGLLAPVFLFAHTDLSVSGFNLSDCDAFGYEGLIYKHYYTALEVLAIVWVFVLLYKAYKKAEAGLKKQILLMGIGMEFFLFSFFSMVYVITTMVEKGYFTDSNYEWYGLVGMTVFMTMMGVLIVRFKTFNVGAAASTVLVFALLILVGSQFAFSLSTTGVILTSFTLIVTGIMGVLLMRSVKKEIEQRKKLQELTQQLAVANERLQELDKLKSEFVSIASHQLRSPLTAIRGYASLLLDGSYGKMPKKAHEPLERISESSRNMAYSIEDYLNVSRIESGNMKYNFADMNLKDEADHIVDDLRSQAIQRGLGIMFRTELKSRGVINADVGKVVQIIQNLINNSIKYTEKGSIKVFVWDDVVNKKIYVDITDTGIGMSKKTQEGIFGKFERADNANTVNNRGTGLGLYVARMMAQGMGGDIKAFSEGEGKGSRFTVEFPLAM